MKGMWEKAMCSGREVTLERTKDKGETDEFEENQARESRKAVKRGRGFTREMLPESQPKPRGKGCHLIIWQ